MNKYIIAGSAQDIPLYDCRPFHYSPTELEDRGWKNVGLGLSFLLYGITAEVCYIFALVAMFSQELRRLSCYKIMAILGLYDMLAIAVNSIITGYLWIVGGWYCTHPDMIYISGAFGLALWCGACMNCFVLVLNRLIDLWKPHLVKQLFGGKRTFVILLLPFLYFLYFFLFTPPIIFNSARTAWFFDPLVSDHEDERFYNFPHTVNNLIIVVATCVLYSFVIAVLVKMFNLSNNGGPLRVTSNQLSIIIQTTTICMVNLGAALIYVYMQFFTTPKWLVLFGHMSWQAGHGIPAFVYLLMNRTIREKLKEILLKNESTNTVSTACAPNSKVHDGRRITPF